MKMIDLAVAVALTGLVAAPMFVAAARADIVEPTSSATAAAISALYVGGDEAQAAIDNDWCGEGELDELAGDALEGEALRQYGHISDVLLIAFDESEGTDSAVERVLYEFCSAAGER